MSANRTQTVLEAERRKQGLSYTALGKIFRKKRGTAWRYCLPRDHKDHRRPDEEASRLMRRWSGDAITIANYADPSTPLKPKRKART